MSKLTPNKGNCNMKENHSEKHKRGIRKQENVRNTSRALLRRLCKCVADT